VVKTILTEESAPMKNITSTALKGNLGGFLHRVAGAGSMFLDNGKPIWNYHKWGDVPSDEKQAAIAITSFNKNCSANQEYASIRCVGCKTYHNQADWRGTHCPACEVLTVDKKWAAQHGVTAPKSFSVGSAQNMKNGEVRKLPHTSSPLWTTQWAAQGSAKAPYIVSFKAYGPFGGNVTSEGWACSCPDFTRHTPRAECKHICWVLKFEGKASPKVPVALLPDAQQEAFQKFLRQQAERGTPALPAGKTKDLFAKGRRFR
jgi:hypothetical protein